MSLPLATAGKSKTTHISAPGGTVCGRPTSRGIIDAGTGTTTDVTCKACERSVEYRLEDSAAAAAAAAPTVEGGRKMRLIEQVEMATTISTEIYAGALDAHDDASAAALELLPLIGTSGFTKAARQHADRIEQKIKDADWLDPRDRAEAENHHQWLTGELKDEA